MVYRVAKKLLTFTQHHTRVSAGSQSISQASRADEHTQSASGAALWEVEVPGSSAFIDEIFLKTLAILVVVSPMPL
jgi:hypothetical protein